MTLPAQLQQRVSAALATLDLPLPEGFTPEVVPAADARFGDYQTNAAMLLAKAAKTNPRALAQALVEALPPDPAVASVEIAGPGFINFRLAPSAWQAVHRRGACG